MPHRIVFTGPESSGKTTLTKMVAEEFDCPWLPEYARDYLTRLGRPYRPADLVEIAKGQLQSQVDFAKRNPNCAYHFFDTSLLVIKIWSVFKYGFYNIQLEKLLLKNLPDCFILCDYQIPWEYDELRETPQSRDVLYDLYKKNLEKLNVPFYEISGNKAERLVKVKEILSHI
ncbi:MAG: ATP-binding protein [Bacteroidota bacterium]